MRHSPFPAIWISLGAVLLSLLTTFFSLWVAQRKKAAGNPPPSPDVPAQELLQR